MATASLNDHALKIWQTYLSFNILHNNFAAIGVLQAVINYCSKY